MLEAEFLRNGVEANIGASRKKLQVTMRSQVSDETLVGIGLSATELVVEMSDDNYDPDLFSYFEQDTQQRDRVGSARDSRRDTVASPQHFALAHVMEHLFAHRKMV